MSGILGYALGYEDGRSSGEVSRGNRELLERALYGVELIACAGVNVGVQLPDQPAVRGTHFAEGRARLNAEHSIRIGVWR